MNWIKKGLIFDSGEQRAQMPTALVMDKWIRIYYNIRDAKSQAWTYFIDVDKKNPKKIIRKSTGPIMLLGERGAFDDAGVLPSAIIQKDGGYLLYYIGVSLAVNVPYKCHIGIAKSLDGEIFTKGGLLLTNDIYLATTPFVMNGGVLHGVWYASGKGWVNSYGKMEPVYQISGIKPKSKYEATCRPAVIFLDGKYHMWFSHRNSFDFRGGKGSYKMGYATSSDGMKWKRNDKLAGIGLGKKGEFDSEMVAYPNTVRVGKKLYMFYNGNGFGKSGIGYAICDL